MGPVLNSWSPDNINLRGNSNRWPYNINSVIQLGHVPVLIQPCGFYLIIKLKVIQFIIPQARKKKKNEKNTNVANNEALTKYQSHLFIHLL